MPSAEQLKALADKMPVARARRHASIAQGSSGRPAFRPAESAGAYRSQRQADLAGLGGFPGLGKKK